MLLPFNDGVGSPHDEKQNNVDDPGRNRGQDRGRPGVFAHIRDVRGDVSVKLEDRYDFARLVDNGHVGLGKVDVRQYARE